MIDQIDSDYYNIILEEDQMEYNLAYHITDIIDKDEMD